MEIAIVALVIWLAFGVAGGMMMRNKGRSGCGGFFLGIVLGPIGLAFALVAPESTERRIEKEEMARGRGQWDEEAERERRLRERIRAEERQRAEEELRREREERGEED